MTHYWKYKENLLRHRRKRGFVSNYLESTLPSTMSASGYFVQQTTNKIVVVLASRLRWRNKEFRSFWTIPAMSEKYIEVKIISLSFFSQVAIDAKEARSRFYPI
jgi:hypothetical protein